MQQYDVQVEWQTVQHYLRRGASEMLLELFVLFRKIVWHHSYPAPIEALGRGGLAIPYQTQK